jgi:hypothetical protein
MAAQSVVEMPSAHQSPAAEMIELQPFQNAIPQTVEGAQAANDSTALTRDNLLKVLAASMSFFFAGNNDGSLGALTPYILRTYSVGTEHVALM